MVGRHPDVFGRTDSLFRLCLLLGPIFVPFRHDVASSPGFGSEETPRDTSIRQHDGGQVRARRLRIVISLTAEEREHVSEKGQEVTPGFRQP
jgi:hypothetical protein